ncbi:MAG: TlyA family RNA methyltransferase [Thermoanaerobaculia bacterium]|nr:TlyA family RNA methyltransferase [Thermoanaerobaculia bacterium]
MPRVRLDQLLYQRGFAPSREKAKRAVMAGEVLVDGQKVDKPGTQVAMDAELHLLRDPEPFVSRAGRKLAAALDHFQLDPRGLRCLDVGASTGGFTDCLLQRGAVHVVALDVGTNQLDYSLRRDPRVTSIEKTNARHLTPGDLPGPFDLVTLDLSFISLTKVVPPLLVFLRRDSLLLPLVKPQFEAGRELVGKGGIVRDAAVRSRIIEERVHDLEQLEPSADHPLHDLRLHALGTFDSPVHGSEGNRESFALFRLS